MSLQSYFELVRKLNLDLAPNSNQVVRPDIRALLNLNQAILTYQGIDPLSTRAAPSWASASRLGPRVTRDLT
jgi:hypothetical protein